MLFLYFYFLVGFLGVKGKVETGFPGYTVPYIYYEFFYCTLSRCRYCKIGQSHQDPTGKGIVCVFFVLLPNLETLRNYKVF